MVDPRWPDERTLEAMSVALKAVPVDTGRAWARVWARVSAGASRPLARWPLAASLSVVTALLVAAQFGPVGALTRPTLAAVGVPAPHLILETPSAGRDVSQAQATTAPLPFVTPTPVPLPPGQS